MKVELLSNSMLSNAVIGGRTCWNSFHKGGCYTSPTDDISDEDKEFLSRTINKHKHGSISEHITYTFSIKGVSRALLQELARHRMASPSVRSSRYTLKELKDEPTFSGVTSLDLVQSTPYELWLIQPSTIRANKYLVFTGVYQVDVASVKALESLRDLVASGIANDKVKYCMPECYRTELVWTINARSLMNFLALRSSPAALAEIRTLSTTLFEALPASHRFLYEDILCS